MEKNSKVVNPEEFSKSLVDLENKIDDLEDKIREVKKKRKELILTQAVANIIERMRKNDIEAIDLMKLDAEWEWDYGIVDRKNHEVFLALKLNEEGQLCYTSYGYEFLNGELFVGDGPGENVVNSYISDTLLDYIQELAQYTLNEDEEDYICDFVGEPEVDRDEIAEFI